SGQCRHEALQEGAVGLIDHPLRFGGDRAEDQGTLARPRHPGEDRQPALRQVDADIFQVVLPRPVNADQVVGVSSVLCIGLGGHRPFSQLNPSGAVNCPALLTMAMRCAPVPSGSALTDLASARRLYKPNLTGLDPIAKST